jgi:hypothetical protein
MSRLPEPEGFWPRHVVAIAHLCITSEIATMRPASFVQVMLALICLLASLPSAAQRLNDTGQISCYALASTGTVSPETPDPEPANHDEQDCTRGAAAADAVGRMVKIGGSSVPGRDYSKIANDGSVLAADAMLGSGPADWACTRDNITGLIWEIRTDDNGLRDKDWIYTWYDTDGNVNGGDAGFQAGSGCNGTLLHCNTTAYRDAVNLLSVGLCGATDWRLPTLSELGSLVDAGAASEPFVDAVWFPGTAGDFISWTRESYASPIPSLAWYVNFDNGALDGTTKATGGYVRLVRGGQ